MASYTLLCARGLHKVADLLVLVSQVHDISHDFFNTREIDDHLVKKPVASVVVSNPLGFKPEPKLCTQGECNTTKRFNEVVAENHVPYT